MGLACFCRTVSRVFSYVLLSLFPKEYSDRPHVWYQWRLCLTVDCVVTQLETLFPHFGPNVLPIGSGDRLSRRASCDDQTASMVLGWAVPANIFWEYCPNSNNSLAFRFSYSHNHYFSFLVMVFHMLLQNQRNITVFHYVIWYYSLPPGFGELSVLKIFVSEIDIRLNRGTLKCVNIQRIKHLLGL